MLLASKFGRVLWYHSFGAAEVIFIAAFLLFYLLYVIRIIRVGRAFHASTHRLWIKFILRGLAFVLLLVAFLGPLFGTAKKEVKTVGKDIMICVDISKSMDAFDIPPTRLAKVKFELKKIVESFSSDRIGIIIFSSEAFMQCPLTYDQNALDLFIETLNSGLAPSGGTDFGPPLRMALSKLQNDEGVSQTKSKVIVLISDGEDFGEATDEIAGQIEDQGIKLFTLGIGTARGGYIRTANGLKTDKNGNTVVSRLESKSLQHLAATTGGQYFEINETRNDVSRLINTIGSIEGELRDSRMMDVSSNKYFYFLGLAIFLLLVDMVTNVKTVRI